MTMGLMLDVVIRSARTTPWPKETKARWFQISKLPCKKMLLILRITNRSLSKLNLTFKISLIGSFKQALRKVRDYLMLLVTIGLSDLRL